MRTVTTHDGQTINLDWNLYAEMMLERINNQASEAMTSKLAQSLVIVLSAIHGGTDNCSMTLEGLSRMVGKDMKLFAELCQAATEEVTEFRSFNEQFALEGKKKE